MGIVESNSFEDSMWEMYLRSGISQLMPKLEDGLFHCTDIRGIVGIGESGKIEPNTGDFPFSFPQSQASFGFNNGWICLFDFSGLEERQLALHHWKWQSFFITHCIMKIILKLTRANLTKKLIPNSIRPLPNDNNYKVAMPIVESWYPEPIDIQSISKCIIAVQKNLKLIVSEYELNELMDALRKYGHAYLEESCNG